MGSVFLCNVFIMENSLALKYLLNRMNENIELIFVTYGEYSKQRRQR